MKTIVRRWVPGVLFACMAAQAAAPPASRGFREVPLRNGFNRITLAGHEATVAYAWRENYNAHGFSVATIYARPGKGDAGRLLLVPVFGEPGNALKERHELTVSGGADCRLQDFALFDSGSAARLVRAWRGIGTGYAAAAPVHFDIYRFERNSDGLPGRPPFDFRFERRVEAAHAYCDVDEAMERELRL
jgi:hypothetical protein